LVCKIKVDTSDIIHEGGQLWTPMTGLNSILMRGVSTSPVLNDKAGGDIAINHVMFSLNISKDGRNIKTFTYILSIPVCL